MVEKNNPDQYKIDTVSGLAYQVIKRLWILIVILVALLFGSNAAWIWYESQFETVVVTQDVDQETENGTNHFIGGDYYGTAESENNGQTPR